MYGQFGHTEFGKTRFCRNNHVRARRLRRMEPVAPPFDAAAGRPPASLLSSLDATYSDLPPARPAPHVPTLSQETVLAVEAQAEPADDVAMDGDEGMTGNGVEVRAASGWIQRGYCSAEEKKRRRAQRVRSCAPSHNQKKRRARGLTRAHSLLRPAC